MSKHVIIMGAGVGGLTAAHELSRAGIKCTVIERNSEAGGQARSKWVNKNHSEYCWHAIGSSYHNFLSIIKEIPDVFQNLKLLEKYIYVRNEGNNITLDHEFLANCDFEQIKAMGKTMTMLDYLILAKMMLTANLLPLNWLKSYDSVLWLDYCKQLSPELYRWVAESPAIYLGMDIDYLSTYTMLHLLRHKTNPVLDGDFYSFAGPINDCFFNPWVELLKFRGVDFKFNTEVVRFDTENNCVHLRTHDNNNNNNILEPKFLEPIDADFYINSMPIESYAKILINSANTPNIREYALQMNYLRIQSRQIQTQVLLFLDVKLNTENKTTLLIMPDTPWFLMLRVESDLWQNNMLLINYKEIISVGIGIFSKNGIVFDRPAAECTPNQLISECIEQIVTYPNINNKIVINRKNIIHADVWDSFKHVNGMLTTYEPKFSNSINTLEARPQTISAIKNMFNATAYCDTDAHIFNMESAVEAGISAANEVKKSIGNLSIRPIITKDKPKPVLLIIQILLEYYKFFIFLGICYILFNLNVK